MGGFCPGRDTPIFPGRAIAQDTSGLIGRGGGFAPAGLVAWASQLGLGVAVTPVGGALVANLALILVLR